jgi:CRP/FNR family transcriptional regulator, nitrogen oxide reductase regulator
MVLTPNDLRRVDTFREAGDDDLQAILDHSLTRPIEEGAFLFFQGDPASHAYILTAGLVKLCQIDPNGQQVNLRTVNPWQVFGAVGAVRPGARYPVCAQALEDSTSLAVESEVLRRLTEANPQLAFGLMQLMTGYIQEIQERYRELATQRVDQRIARALLRLASQAGERVEEGVLIELPFSRQDLAEMTGTTLYTVSRTLSEWERRGLLQTGRGRVTIRQMHGLVRVAEDLPE